MPSKNDMRRAAQERFSDTSYPMTITCPNGVRLIDRRGQRFYAILPDGFRIAINDGESPSAFRKRVDKVWETR